MIKAVMFDFDGVIVESAGIKTVAFRRMFEKYPKHQKLIVDYHLRYMGISRYEKFRYIFKNILELPLTTEQEKELGKKFSDLVMDEVLAASFVPGASEFLEGFSKNYSLFIVSGTPGEELKEIVVRRGIDGYFKETHGSPPGKVEIIKDILHRFELLPTEAIFVGDAESDYEAARDTGLTFVARRSSETSDELLEKSFYQLEDLQGLGNLLNTIS